MDAKLINSISLVFGIVGGLLIWRYGIPSKVDLWEPGAKLYNVREGRTQEAEQALRRRHKIMPAIGVWLLIFGFIFQLVSNYW